MVATKRRFEPNLQRVRIVVDGVQKRAYVCARCLKSGKVAKAEPITQAEDLTAAKEQSAAMGKASVSLQKAVGKAVYANKGYKAVSVYPSVKDGEPVAEVTLVKGDDWKTVTEKLK